MTKRYKRRMKGIEMGISVCDNPNLCATLYGALNGFLEAEFVK